MSSPREAANAIHQRYQAKFASISSNSRLSADGKARELAPLYLGYRNELATVQGNAKAATTRRVSELTRTAFGVPSDPIAAMSYRDALGRAEQIDNPQIAAMKLTQSIETGDTLMAQALARHASESGWNSVLEQYTAATPSAGRALTQLAEIQRDQSSVQNIFMDAAHFMVQKPAELSKLQDYQIEALATETQPVGG